MGQALRTLLNPVIVGALVFSISACASKDPEPISYGRDNCEYCKMTIVDKSFGAELVTTKGKKFTFDSIECLAAFRLQGTVDSESVFSMWVTDAANPANLINIAEALFVFSKDIKSPMSVGLAAYDCRQSEDSAVLTMSGEAVNWEQLTEIVNQAWFNKK